MKEETKKAALPVRILIGHRGWVWVGRVVSESLTEVVLKPSRCLRIWGTTEGLAELAEKGPLKDTKMDDSATLRIHPLAIVASLDCEEEPWNKHLKPKTCSCQKCECCC